MSEVVKNFYTIRFKTGKCTEETLAGLVTAGKLTEAEMTEILGTGT